VTWLWVLLSFVGGLLVATVGDIVSDEIRAHLDNLPLGLLKLAARRLPAELRIRVYEEEWLPELHWVLRGDDAKPITRLIHGVRYSVGLWRTSTRIAEELTGGAVRRRIVWAPGRWVRVLAGIDETVLDWIPQERARYTGLGGVVLMTGAMAGVSMAFALSMLRGPWWIVVFASVLWGAMVLSLDRWIVASAHGAARMRRLLVFVPRLVMAILFGVVIAESLVLTIFESNTMQQIENNRSAQVAAFEATLRACSPSGGMASASALCAGVTGSGTSAEFDRKVALKVAEFRASVNRPAGLLEREEALGDLTANHRTLKVATFAIRLLFIAIDCLPILVMVVGGTSAYDRLLLRRIETIERFLKGPPPAAAPFA
jgi:hypothetical protein